MKSILFVSLALAFVAGCPSGWNEPACLPYPQCVCIRPDCDDWGDNGRGGATPFGSSSASASASAPAPTKAGK